MPPEFQKRPSHACGKPSACDGTPSNYQAYKANKAAAAASASKSKHASHGSHAKGPVSASHAASAVRGSHAAHATHASHASHAAKTPTHQGEKHSATHATHAAKVHSHAKKTTRASFAIRPAVSIAAATAAVALGVGAGALAFGGFGAAPTVVVSDAHSYGDSTNSSLVTRASARTNNDVQTEMEAALEDAATRVHATEEVQRNADKASLDYLVSVAATQSATNINLVDFMNMDEMYLAQDSADTCTLCSTAMMMRRAAFLDGRDGWDNINEADLRKAVWNWAGLPHTFEAYGYTVDHGYFESDPGEDRLSEIVELLASHPEGVVVYDQYVPHALLAVYYDTESGILYCADPTPLYSGCALPIEETWNGLVRGSQESAINGITTYWCIEK